VLIMLYWQHSSSTDSKDSCRRVATFKIKLINTRDLSSGSCIHFALSDFLSEASLATENRRWFEAANDVSQRETSTDI